MSKMSQLHAELSEQAYRLGYSSLDNAMADGYCVDYENATLVDGRELAHKDWLKRKEELLEQLRNLRDAYMGVENTEYVLSKTIDFIEEGEI